MPTLINRKQLRGELVALFEATGAFAEVYGYKPSTTEAKGKSPLCVVRGRGTNQDMVGLNLNPTEFNMTISVYVLNSGSHLTFTPEEAEEKLDDLDLLVRQIIRDNTALTSADIIEFDDGPSQVIDTLLDQTPYVVETRVVRAQYPGGS